ncbi:hypothetical protein NKG94_12285 [Micromonospora sp. M12]
MALAVGEQAEHPPRLDGQLVVGQDGAQPAGEQPFGAGERAQQVGWRPGHV